MSRFPVFRKIIAVFALAMMLVSNIAPSYANIVFQIDNYQEVPSKGILIDSSGTTDTPKIKFGIDANSPILQYDELGSRMQLDKNLEISGPAAIAGAGTVTNAGATVTFSDVADCNAVNIGSAITAAAATFYVTVKNCGSNEVTVNGTPSWSGDSFAFKNALLGLQDNTANRLVVRSDGKIAAGTTNPQGDLHVNGSTNGAMVMGFDGSNASGTGYYTTFDTNGGAKKWSVGSVADNAATSPNHFEIIQNTDQTDAAVNARRLVIDDTGNVGIGDSTPDHLLDVNGNIGMTAGGYINMGDTDGGTGYGFRDNGGDMQFSDSGGTWTNFSAFALPTLDDAYNNEPGGAGTPRTVTADDGNVVWNFSGGYNFQVTGGSFTAGSTANVNGTANLNGDVNLGDADTDNIVYTGEVNSNIVPNTDDTYSLGVTGKRWGDVYVGPTNTLHFGTTANDVQMGYMDAGGTDVLYTNSVFGVVQDPMQILALLNPTSGIASTLIGSDSGLSFSVDDDGTTNRNISMQLDDTTGGASSFTIADSGGDTQVSIASNGATVFNEQGNDADFRVEGDTEANLLLVDAGTSTVSTTGNATLGDANTDTITFNGEAVSNIVPDADDTYDLGTTGQRWQDVYVGPSSLHIGSTANDITLSYYNPGTGKTLLSNSPVAVAAGANSLLILNSSTNNYNSTLTGADGGLNVSVNEAATTTRGIAFKLDDTAGASSFVVNTSGSDTAVSIASNGAAVFNEQGNDADFRVEGDTNTNTFYLDASANSVGIGTNAPSGPLNVVIPNSGNAVYFDLNDGGPGVQWDSESLEFRALNDASEMTPFSDVQSIIMDEVNGTERGELTFMVARGNTTTTPGTLLTGLSVGTNDTRTGHDEDTTMVRVGQGNASLQNFKMEVWSDNTVRDGLEVGTSAHGADSFLSLYAENAGGVGSAYSIVNDSSTGDFVIASGADGTITYPELTFDTSASAWVPGWGSMSFGNDDSGNDHAWNFFGSGYRAFDGTNWHEGRNYNVCMCATVAGDPGECTGHVHMCFQNGIVYDVVSHGGSCNAYTCPTN